MNTVNTMNKISDKENALNGGNFRISVKLKTLILKKTVTGQSKKLTEVNEDGKQQI